MKLPYLSFWDVTPVSIKISDGSMDVNGELNIVDEFEGLCNYNEVSKTVRAPDGQLIQLGAILYVGEDISPSTSVITGTVQINGREWNIHRADRPRNPDGTVHSTRLELT